MCFSIPRISLVPPMNWPRILCGFLSLFHNMVQVLERALLFHALQFCLSFRFLVYHRTEVYSIDLSMKDWWFGPVTPKGTKILHAAQQMSALVLPPSIIEPSVYQWSINEGSTLEGGPYWGPHFTVCDIYFWKKVKYKNFVNDIPIRLMTSTALMQFVVICIDFHLLDHIINACLPSRSINSLSFLRQRFITKRQYSNDNLKLI